MEFQTDNGVIGQNEDLTQILPIQQKRTIAFINGFIMQTVSFLNNFAQSCESRFMELEYRMQKVEASLLILESQLSSIDSLNSVSANVSTKTEADNPENTETENAAIVIDSSQDNNVIPEDVDSKVEESKLKVDVMYQKFFKMVQVGVPIQAVKLKMQNEGLDPNVLEASGNIEFTSNEQTL